MPSTYCGSRSSKKEIKEISVSCDAMWQKCLDYASERVVRLDNGTLLYYTRTSLYVKWERETVYAVVPGDISVLAAFGDAAYFESKRKIFKVIAWQQNIIITHDRDLAEAESVDARGMCTITRSGQRFACRMCDQPDVALPVPDNKFCADYYLVGMHRGKLLYIRRKKDGAPKFYILSATANGISLAYDESHSVSTYIQPKSPYLIFIAVGSRLFCVDVIANVMHPVLHFTDLTNVSVVSAKGSSELILAESREFSPTVLYFSQFPKKYFEKKQSIVVRVTCDVNRIGKQMEEEKPKITLDERIKELSKQFEATQIADGFKSQHEKYHDKKIEEWHKELNNQRREDANPFGESAEGEVRRMKWEEETSTTLNQLLDQNIELVQELDRLRKANNEKISTQDLALLEIEERHEELTEIHKELEGQNWQLNEDVDNAEMENQELEAKNEELTEEVSKLEAELEQKEEEMKKKTLPNQNAELPSQIEQNKELKRRIELMQKQNEILSKALSQHSEESSSDESYETIPQ